MGRARVGLPLRPEDARTAMAGMALEQAIPALAGAQDDITLHDLYGTWKTDANAVGLDRTSDAFACAVFGLVPAPRV